MPFNYRLLLRQLTRSIFCTRGTPLQLKARRVRFLAVFALAFPVMLLSSVAGMLVDEVAYRRYRRVRVRQPVFIIGNFRSGSTFLHRLLARDSRQFSSMKTWEIYFAPSVAQRRFWQGLWAVDAALGGRLLRAIRRGEERVLGRVKLHRVRLSEPEEDEALFYYTWHTLFTWFFFPEPQRGTAYHHYDDAVPAPVRRKNVSFYRRCLQRHLFVHGCERHYLAKNPSSTPRIRSLLREFPDARFICLVRDPREAVPSTMSWFSFAWHYFADPPERHPFRDFVLDLTSHWYACPLQILPRLSPRSWTIVRYDDLVADPRGTVAAIYERFGLELSPQYEAVLRGESERARSHRGENHYDLADVGLDQEKIRDIYGDVLAAYEQARLLHS